MSCKKCIIFTLMLIVVMDAPNIASEAMKVESQVITDLTTLEIESPLVEEDVAHSQLHISPFDAEHYLFPVKIISIDGWDLTDDIVESQLRLSEGEHKLVVIPDFSNIEPQYVYMNRIWEEKRIGFALRQEQDIAISARLLDREKLVWEVQIYQVIIPADEINLENEL